MMKRIVLFLALALLLCAASAQALNMEALETFKQALGLVNATDTAPTLATREELVAYLQACALLGSEDVSFYYDEALAEDVADRAWMTAAVGEAGIDDASWSRDTNRNFLEFKWLVYYPEFAQYREEGTPLPPTFQTLDEAAEHLWACALDGRDAIVFYYARELDLYQNSEALSNVIYSNGVKRFDWSIDPYARRVALSKLDYYPEFAQYREMGTPLPPTFQTLDEAAEHLWACALDGRDTIVFYFAGEQDLYQNSEALSNIIYSNGVKSFDWSFDPSGRRVVLSGLIYYPNRFRVRTMQEAQAAMAACRRNTLGSASIYFSGEMYAKLSAEDFRELYLLENEAAMAQRSMVYNEACRYVHYSDIRYEPLYFHCKTLQDVQNAFTVCSDALGDTLALYLTEELYQTLNASDSAMLNILENDCGMAERGRRCNEAGRSIQYDNIAYYPGMRILSAVRNGDTGSLTDKEDQLLQKALRMVSEARAQSASELELELALFDAVCVSARYDKTTAWFGSMDERDTAIGALLNGVADCDGYADAFYLLGNLAGLEVRCKSGDAQAEYAGSAADSKHMWNLIRLNGQWYMVDVTWGDREEGAAGAYDYYWLNLGTDRAALTHVWNPETVAVPLAERTDPALFYYTRQGLQFFNLREAAAYVYESGKAGRAIVQVMLSGGAYTGDDDFVDNLNAVATGGVRYSYFTREIGEDIYLTVYWKVLK